MPKSETTVAPLTIENLSYGLRDPLFDSVTLTLAMGDFVNLVVKENAARAALLECLTGNVKPTMGRIRFFGRENRGFARELIQHRVGWIIAKKETHAPWIRLDEYLRGTGGLFKTWNEELCQKFIKDFELDSTRRMIELSPVETAKVRFVRALSIEPEVIVIEETALEVPDQVKQLLMQTLETRFKEGRLAILSIGLSKEVPIEGADSLVKRAIEVKAPRKR